MNIFEGARRVSKLVFGLVVFGSVVFAVTNNPSVNPHYTFDEATQFTEVINCTGGPEFYAHPQGMPSWVSVTVCGWSEGPSEVSLQNPVRFDLEKKIEVERWEGIGRAIGWVIGTGVFGWVAIWAIGWIVRGFLGIPTGSDYKVTPAP
jgi:hypothetical protein